MTELEKACLDLQETCRVFNLHMHEQMLQNMELKKRLADNKHQLELLLEEQNADKD